MYHCKADRRMLLDPYHANGGEIKWGYPSTGRPKLKKEKEKKKKLFQNSS
jgi:hypothetical protein